MIVASGIAMQFGAKPLFSDVSVKFGGGNRYGLIGANGCGNDACIDAFRDVGLRFRDAARQTHRPRQR